MTKVGNLYRVRIRVLHCFSYPIPVDIDDTTNVSAQINRDELVLMLDETDYCTVFYCLKTNDRVCLNTEVGFDNYFELLL